METHLQNIVLVSTMDCNWACPFCHQRGLREKYGLNAGDMSIETMHKILDTYDPECPITVSGGEPFLNLPILEELVRIGRPFTVHTNGSILYPNTADLKAIHSMRISINSIDPPPLFKQLIEEKANCTIRVNTFLDDPQKTSDIVHFISKTPVFDHMIRGDMFTGKDDSMEERTKQFAQLVKDVPLPGKNRGYNAYIRGLFSSNEIVKYAPSGAKVPGIYMCEVPPEKWDEEMGPWSYADRETFRDGHAKYHLGIDAFDSPGAYYTSMMYEELHKVKGYRDEVFNQFFKPR